MINLLSQPFLIAFLISFATTPLVIYIFTKKGWVEKPDKKKHPKIIHTRPVPRGGGIPIYLAIFVVTLIFLPLDNHLLAILIAGFINLAIGVVDDLFDISPYLRLGTNSLSALIIIAGGIGIAFITNPFGGILHLDQPQLTFNLFGQIKNIWLVSDIFTIIWIIWCMNIVSWSGGVDGQLPGFVTIAAITIGVLSLGFSQDIAQWPVIILAGAVAGGYLGFLPFNFFPQKIMPGYSGKSLAGFFLAILAILSGAKVATAILVLAVPMIDGMITIIRRLVKKHSPFWGDAEHLHHLMLKAGVSKPKIAIYYWLLSAFLGMIVLNLNSKQKFWAFAMLFLLVGGGIILVRAVINKKEK